LVAPDPEALAALPADQWLLAASHNLPAHPLGAALNPRQGVPAATPPLPPRLIALPAALLEPAGPVLNVAKEAPLAEACQSTGTPSPPTSPPGIILCSWASIGSTGWACLRTSKPASPIKSLELPARIRTTVGDQSRHPCRTSPLSDPIRSVADVLGIARSGNG